MSFASLLFPAGITAVKPLFDRPVLAKPEVLLLLALVFAVLPETEAFPKELPNAITKVFKRSPARSF